MILMPLDRGRFVVVHPCSTFSHCRQLSTSLNAEVQKTAKTVLFSPPEGDIINRSRRILTRKRCVIAHQIWPSSVKGISTGTPKVTICQKLWVLATGSRRNEHIHMKFGV